jgi:hypothetical protein
MPERLQAGAQTDRDDRVVLGDQDAHRRPH